MSRDKKKDDDESPADWVARQSRLPRGLRPTAQAQTEHIEDRQLRRRSDREEDEKRRYYQSARNWRSEKPLIDRIDNAWQSSKQTPYHDEDDPIARICDPDDDNSCPNVTGRMARSRRWRRLFIVLLVVLCGSSYLWMYHIWPVLQDDYELKAGFLRQPKGAFGVAMGGDYEFAKEKIMRLDDSLVPGAAQDPDGRRRLVFVGDIHGCKDELLKLLKRVDYDEKNDHLIATGDIISKGPDSPGVVDELIQLNATSVRGNHEDRILTLAAVRVEKFGQPDQLSKTAQKDSKLLKKLKPHHLAYLRDLPLILRIPPLPLALASKKKTDETTLRSEILVVHAGLVPAVPLDKQDPYFVMNMRSLRATTHVPSNEPASKKAHLLPWVDSWNWYHSRLAKGRTFHGWHRADPGLEGEGESSWFDDFLSYFQQPGRRHKGKPKAQVVVYGHDSMAGFTERKWSKGLDTRCVNGGALTAMIVNASGEVSYDEVHCKDHLA